MEHLETLFANNRRWAEEMRAADSEFFTRLSTLQAPQYLWIGCADSRVPANQITGLLPGEVFVHRNVANLVIHTDLNCLSVLQFAVDVLKVKHVIVCGHYGCGGVQAALENRKLGLIDNWLRHIQDVRDRYADAFEDPHDPKAHDRLCELNVIEQVVNVVQTTILRDAWERGQSVTVHGWLYRLNTGLIHDLGMTLESHREFPTVLNTALDKVLG